MNDDWRRGYDLPDLLNLSAKVDPKILDGLRSQVSRVLEDNPFIATDCPRIQQKTLVTDVSCPYYIKAPIFKNCSLIANFFGPFTAKEVAYMMDLTIDTVYHIEKSAMQKLREHLTTKDRKDLLS